ncbi:cell division/cell wall cluster transcriptional repressor MraZ, partial [Vibrio cholerae O1]|nr:cell division/cell wall cluster transcriptional repressor MraZ [Vibrio cholerae O1]
KGRLILPAKFRDELSPGLVLTRGQENCLTLFPTTEFEAEHERIQNAPKTNKEARDYQRVFLSAAFADQPDKQ